MEVYLIYFTNEESDFILLGVASSLKSCGKMIKEMKKKKKSNGILPYTDIYVTTRKVDEYLYHYFSI